MMQPGQKKVLRQPIQPAHRTAYGQEKGMDWADGAVQTMFGAGGAGAGQTLFQDATGAHGVQGGAKKDAPGLATLATDILLIGVKIRETPQLGDPDPLRRLLAAYFKDFERTALSHGKPQEAVEQAKYALAAFVDETIINGDNNCREAWIAEPLQSQFFNDTQAGENFFKRLEGMLGDMQRHVEILEVYYLCLALGFQGRYRVMGPERLSNVVRNLLKRIEAIKGAPPKALAPSAYVHPGLHASGKSGKPLLLAAASFLVVALVLYFVLMFAGGASLSPARKAVERLQGGISAP